MRPIARAAGRKLLDGVLGVHPEARLPDFHAEHFRGASRAATALLDRRCPPAARAGKVALFATCYGNRNEPDLVEDLVAVLEHNGIPVALARTERCCGMPKLELGDLDAVAKLKDSNIPALAAWSPRPRHRRRRSLLRADVQAGAAAPVPGRRGRAAVAEHVRSVRIPDASLMRRAAAHRFHRRSASRYHVPCHLRVQNIGLKTRDLLALVPDTKLTTIERCSGHDGTYAVKREFHEVSMKIGRPVVQPRRRGGADSTSDCPMAGHQIARAWTLGSTGRGSRGIRCRCCGGLGSETRMHREPLLTREDLMSLEQYATRSATHSAPGSSRTSARRTVAIGPNMTWVFEDQLTIQYQVQEMLRIERIFEADGHPGGARRLQPADPGRRQLEGDVDDGVPRPEERRGRAGAAERRREPLLRRGARQRPRVAVADEDQERANAEKTSAVHWLRFELPAQMRARSPRAPRSSPASTIQNYRHSVAPRARVATRSRGISR